MNVPTVRAHVTLENISLVVSLDGTNVPGLFKPGTWFNPGMSFNPGTQSPIYLWTVFFKIDGDTALVDENLSLKGTATVVPTPGNHGDLPAVGPDAGIISIPVSLGDFRPILAPIPLKTIPGVTVPGVLGCVAILMIQASTGNDALAQGHSALNSSLQQQLNNLIPTLGIKNQNITDNDVQAIKDQVNSAVTSAVKNALSFWDQLSTGLGFEDQDSSIGAAVYYVSANELASSPPAGISVGNGYPSPVNLTYTTPVSVAAPSYDVTLNLKGTITGDPLPLSLSRILTRVGKNTVHQAMTATQYTFKPPASLTAWIDAIT